MSKKNTPTTQIFNAPTTVNNLLKIVEGEGKADKKNRKLKKIIISVMIVGAVLVIGAVVIWLGLTKCAAKNPNTTKNPLISTNEPIIYEINDDDKTVTACINTASAKGDVSIYPEYEINGKSYTVTAIGAPPMVGNGQVTSINLPNTLKRIEKNAFQNFTKLTEVILPKSVVYIGENAFIGCTSLKTVNINDLTAWHNIEFNGEYSNPLYYATLKLNNEPLSGEIVLSDSVIKIPDYTFRNTAISSISMSDNVTYLGKDAFVGCTQLTSAVLSKNLNEIFEGTFSGCGKLQNLEIPFVGGHSEAIKGDRSSVFGYIFGSKEYEGGKQCVQLPMDFDYLMGIENDYQDDLISESEYSEKIQNYQEEHKYAVWIPQSFSSIKINGDITDFAFALFDFNEDEVDNESNTITSIAVNKIEIANAKYIGYGAFNRCESLENVTLGNGITTIGFGAFEYCKSLESITIPDGVTNIGWHAFDGCESLTNITIPDSVISIGDYAFDGCESLTSVYITDIAAWCNIEFNGEYSNPLYYATLKLNNEPLSGEIVLSDSVTKIPDYTFRNTAISSISMSDKVTYLGKDAFVGCTQLTTANLNDLNAWCNIEFNGEYSNPLYYATLKLNNEPLSGEIVLSDSVTKIPDYTFRNTAISSISMSDKVTYLGKGTFVGCILLESIEIPNSVSSIDAAVFYNCTSLTNVAIPNRVTSIGDDAFYNCISLTNVAIPNRITSIGDYAFYNCESLRSITIPDSVISIGKRAFENCTSLESITIPDSVTNIGWSAFYKCISLKSVKIGDGVNSIESYAFYGCPIKNATIPTVAISSISNDNLQTVVITSGDSIGDYAFQNCKLLESVTIPDSVTSIGSYAFYNCTSLESVTIGDGVTSIGYSAFWGTTYYNNQSNWQNDILYIGKYLIKAKGTISGSVGMKAGTKVIADEAFYGCASLKSITIPDSVTSIGKYAFYDCIQLTRIEIPDSVVWIGKNAFKGCSSIEIFLEFIGEKSSWDKDWNPDKRTVYWAVVD